MEDVRELIFNYRKNNVARRLRTKDTEIQDLRLEVQILQDKVLKLEGRL